MPSADSEEGPREGSDEESQEQQRDPLLDNHHLDDIDWQAVLSSPARVLGLVAALCALLLLGDAGTASKIWSAVLPQYNGGLYCPHAPLWGQDRRPDPGRLRIVALNAEYLMFDASEGCKQQWHGCPWSTAAAAHRHLLNVAIALARLNADVISLSEVRSCDELRTLASLLGSDYAPYMVQGSDTYTHQNMGLLSRVDPVTDLWRSDARATWPLPSSACGPESDGAAGTQGVSKHYVAELQLGEHKVALVGAHFLAGTRGADARSRSRCAQREAQAAVIRGTVTGLASHGAHVVVLGDFNDFDRFVPDSTSNAPHSQALHLMQTGDVSVNPYDALPRLQRSAPGWPCSELVLQSVMGKVDFSRRHSVWSDLNKDCVISGGAELSLVDHVLVTEGLVGAVAAADIPLFYGPVQGGQKMCKDDPSYVSDHWPVVVDFDLAKLPTPSTRTLCRVD
ncbi:Endonuclease/exonuclease/phosphatase [Tribonema minus]|uniref:Endonuclease/exonuclease/phosphatase n=1 Tax=Tribonema minus TaxID=303371 RepID=A0A835YI94_9STRA|nr:Endonuclease/exonuclease/phosphatase [Tribonema minus]